MQNHVLSIVPTPVAREVKRFLLPVRITWQFDADLQGAQLNMAHSIIEDIAEHFTTPNDSIVIDSVARIYRDSGGTKGWELRVYVERKCGLFELHIWGRTKCSIQWALDHTIRFDDGRDWRKGYQYNGWRCEASYSVVDIAPTDRRSECPPIPHACDHQN